MKIFFKFRPLSPAANQKHDFISLTGYAFSQTLSDFAHLFLQPEEEELSRLLSRSLSPRPRRNRPVSAAAVSCRVKDFLVGQEAGSAPECAVPWNSVREERKKKVDSWKRFVVRLVTDPRVPCGLPRRKV